jgi:cob(I)alamin adenosyltransferase
MKIYTGMGDRGKTRLFGGEEVDKDHPRLQVYGTLDELNSHIGLILTWKPAASTRRKLLQIQNDIFRISAVLATPDPAKYGMKPAVSSSDIKRLETWIDEMETDLEPLKNFILPGGSRESAGLHVARTICRRAERHLVTLQREAGSMQGIQIYLNRLSDLFFVMARWENKSAGIQDVLWRNE